MKTKGIKIYTDGACAGNPGPGGWGVVLLYNDLEKELSGYVSETTNNRMELLAVIKGLEALKVQNWEVNIYSDSAYVVNAINNNWLANWQNNGWKNSKKEAVANQDLWQRLLELMTLNKVKLNKVKGHSGDKWNERCDKLATDEIKNNS
ncbi:MAG: ribonuclease HI [Syntrophomonadaceae bacterium]|nr:ribonuclease HI [Syntrophomonadaceae bacterium]